VYFFFFFLVKRRGGAQVCVAAARRCIEVIRIVCQSLLSTIVTWLRGDGPRGSVGRAVANWSAARIARQRAKSVPV